MSQLSSQPGSLPPTSQTPRQGSRPQLTSESEYLDDQVIGGNGTIPGADGNVPRRPGHPLYGRGPPDVVDYAGEKVQQAFEGLLESHVEDAPRERAPAASGEAAPSDRYYIAQIHGLARYQLSTLYVDFRHLSSLPSPVLANAIANQYYRFHPFLTKALHNLIGKYEPQYFREHRQINSTSSHAGTSALAHDSATTTGTESAATESLAERTRHQQTDKLFSLAFYNLPLVSRLRQLRSEHIGHLLSISGTVTRTSEVRPELALGTFICEVCNNTIDNVEQIFKYTEPTQCPNPGCGNRLGWRLDIQQSTFVDWQKVKVQESAHEIPTGSMPRTIDVIVRGEMVDRAKAGERCIFTGTLIVVPDVSQLGLPGVRPEASRDTGGVRGDEIGGNGVGGLKALGVRDLTYRMAFLACMVTPDMTTPGQPTSQTNHQELNGDANNVLASLGQLDQTEVNEEQAQDRLLQTLTAHEVEDLKNLVHSDYIYARLVDSLAPMIYGHRTIKKGLLLQMIGGVSKHTQEESMALRGDLNICIVGDPSTSKSQFLK